MIPRTLYIYLAKKQGDASIQEGGPIGINTVFFHLHRDLANHPLSGIRNCYSLNK